MESTIPSGSRKDGNASRKSQNISGSGKGEITNVGILSACRSDHCYSRLDLTANTLYMGPRKLLREGMLSKAKSGRKLRAFLCNDVMVLTDEIAKTLYRMVRSAPSNSQLHSLLD